MKNEETIEFVRKHREDDVHKLALKARRNSDVDLTWALDQIQGWQTARYKLPSWAAIDGIVYPPHLSMEQCSSEQTAIYKCEIVNSLPKESHEMLIDLTGGFGVDFALMAKCCNQAIYVERQEQLCETAKHNFELLGLKHASIINNEAESFLGDVTTDSSSTLLYLDPARRDINKARTYAIADCTPNVLTLLPKLLDVAQHVLIKLSPMLDWHKAVSDLGDHVAEVHIVSVGNDCKEMLVLISSDHEGEPTIHCVNDGQTLIYQPSQDNTPRIIADHENQAYLYEPNASIMKAGCFNVLTERYPVKALATDSHLFVSKDAVEDFPGRSFIITNVASMNKKELKRALTGITRANITTRNFPLSALQLRSRLRLQDGGKTYIFGTTDSTGLHLLYLCSPIS